MRDLDIITPKDRATWLEERRKSIGASDVARVWTGKLGEMELWAEKTGRPTAPKEGMELRFAVGHAMEPVLREFTGLRLPDNRIIAPTRRAIGGETIIRRPGTHLHASPDGLLVDASSHDHVVFHSPDAVLGPVEYKTVERLAAWKWGDDEPDLYAHIQTQAEFAVGAGSWGEGVVAAMIGLGFDVDKDLKIYRVAPHEQAISEILDWSERFWGYVERDEPPPPDGLESTSAAIKLLWPAAREEREGLLPAAYARQRAKAKELGKQIKKLEREKREAEQEILLAMIEADLTEARIAASEEFPKATKVVYKHVERSGYTVEPSEYEFFRVF